MPHDIHTEGSPRQPQSEPQPTGAASWIENAAELASNRIALFQLEAKQVAARNAGRLLMVTGAALAAIVAWLLLIVGITGVVHTFTYLAWYWTCLIIAGIHLLAVVALLHWARSPGPPSFQHTRSEFQKDREWLQNLQHRKFKP